MVLLPSYKCTVQYPTMQRKEANGTRARDGYRVNNAVPIVALDQPQMIALDPKSFHFPL